MASALARLAKAEAAAAKVLAGRVDRLARYRADPAALKADAGTPGDPWQRELLRSDRDRDALLLCARQVENRPAVRFLATAERSVTPRLDDAHCSVRAFGSPARCSARSTRT